MWMAKKNSWEPTLILGLGGAVALIISIETILTVYSRPPSSEWLAGIAMTVPSIGVLLYGGYWLSSSQLSPKRYPRVLHWTLGSLVGFLLLNVPVMVTDPPGTLLILGSWIRWAAAIGAGVGLVVGIFEARAISRTVEAEQQALRAQEAEARKQLLTYLNNLLRHEVLNTANIIEGYADHLHAELVDDTDATEELAIIQRQARQLTSVIEDVRMLLDESHGENVLERIDLTKVVETEVANLRDRYEDVVVETALPEVAVVDGDLMVRRVVGNLLVNAVEHNDSPTPRVTVAIERTPDSVRMEIADNGPGIPTAELEGLFELQSQEGVSHGLGMGLVGVLVERYDATISVTETGPGGTTVTVEFPLPGEDSHSRPPASGEQAAVTR